MKIGTKSVLYGAHCFLIHPWFVLAAWIKLYGFPFDPRLWVAFFVHDLGYFGKPNMDGPEGETHVELGAKIMHKLFDWKKVAGSPYYDLNTGKPVIVYYDIWGNFSRYHSRYYAKKECAQPSKLCFADKLSFVLTPRWLYLTLVNATGEIHEYLKNAKKAETKHWKPVEGQKIWHTQLCKYMTDWVSKHKDGSIDTWTDATRNNTVTESGVWQ